MHIPNLEYIIAINGSLNMPSLILTGSKLSIEPISRSRLNGSAFTGMQKLWVRTASSYNYNAEILGQDSVQL